MSDRFPIPAGFHRVEETIKRSRFITSVDRAPDVDSAREFIARIKEEFPDANHNCWAFNAGPPGDTALVGMSDDGEPGGTAGRPMLHTLLHGDVGQMVVVVTRYFGGVKLGTGGLVRAYSGMVNLALETLPVRQLVATTILRISLPYSAVTLFKRNLPDFEGEIREEQYTDQAGFLVELPLEQVDPLHKALSEMTAGQASINEK